MGAKNRDCQPLLNNLVPIVNLKVVLQTEEMRVIQVSLYVLTVLKIVQPIVTYDIRF